jgi:hypothetical protein
MYDCFSQVQEQFGRWEMAKKQVPKNIKSLHTKHRRAGGREMAVGNMRLDWQ